ncbi:hypothetical protein [Sedimenticola selenatireducens]|uniref:Uncharacterized protein n=1 Tax=Sedimenticola selenatireducens TaxID=191960 RepID=A0A557SMK5_9GAMM|nr:hypothetical protein [Sedimenticola selenatireducens]TVO78657.1 hypothetical protein FHP88_00385 [Sedimenticola selenatireducens]TVT62019.1 MAG: hypothetical protein FHK78_15500 [Sedimenticola selenatireducens]
MNEPVKNADRPEETMARSITWTGPEKMPSVQLAVIGIARESHSLIDSRAIHTMNKIKLAIVHTRSNHSNNCTFGILNDRNTPHIRNIKNRITCRI